MTSPYLPGYFSLDIPGLSHIRQSVLETERLLLREVNTDILDELYTTCTDEQIILFLGLADAAMLEVERGKWKGGFSTYRTSIRQFLLHHKASGTVIGRAGFHNWYAMHSRAELGYIMEQEHMRQQGLMAEAVGAIITHGFRDMNLNRIEAFVGPHNTASLSIMKKFGFTREGVLRQHFCKNGTPEDSVCFSLLRSEYRCS